MTKKKPYKIVAHPKFQEDLSKMVGIPNLKPTEKCCTLDELFKKMDIESNKWYNKYFLYPICRIWYKIEAIPNHTKWFFQRRIRGFDDRELYELGNSMKKWLAPRLERWLKKGILGYPDKLTHTKWKNVLKKILWLAKREINDDWDEKQWKKYRKKEKEAGKLLGKYLYDLWD